MLRVFSAGLLERTRLRIHVSIPEAELDLQFEPLKPIHHANGSLEKGLAYYSLYAKHDATFATSNFSDRGHTLAVLRLHRVIPS